MDSNARKKRIEVLLKNAFDPVSIEVRDDSKLHAGHNNIEEGAKETHFYINMVSLSFKDLSKVKVHRKVYEVFIVGPDMSIELVKATRCCFLMSRLHTCLLDIEQV